MLGAVGDDLFKPDEKHAIQLAKGDFLMVCTDGIGEARDASGNLYDQSALREHLIENADSSGPDLAKAIIAAGRDFSHPDHQWDDITVLGIDLI